MADRDLKARCPPSLTPLSPHLAGSKQARATSGVGVRGGCTQVAQDYTRGLGKRVRGEAVRSVQGRVRAGGRLQGDAVQAPVPPGLHSALVEAAQHVPSLQVCGGLLGVGSRLGHASLVTGSFRSSNYDISCLQLFNLVASPAFRPVCDTPLCTHNLRVSNFGDVLVHIQLVGSRS